VQADQSDGIKSSDLQIAKLGSNFTMVHKMGLIGISLNAKDVYDYVTYDGNTYDSETKTWDMISGSGPKTTWNASTTFTSTDKPLVNGNMCYQVVEPNVTAPSYTASIDEANKKYPWSETFTTVSAAGQYDGSQSVTYNVDYGIGVVWEFCYSGQGQQWEVPITGTYQMECWGAEGKTLNSNRDWPGKGGYTSGEIDLTDETCLYIYVGGTGDLSTANVDAAGGFNGGGYSNSYSGGTTTTGGGGSTDIRIKKHSLGSWGYDRSTHTGDVSLSSRIMVAAGGGGCGNYFGYYVSGGSGGGIYGQPSLSGYKTAEGKYHAGATQTSSASSPCTNSEGHFGYANQKESNHTYGGGGGGGYWGGTRGWGNGGSGGSSYISGHKGCVAIISESNQNPKTGPDNTIEKASHYSGLVFKDGTTIIIDGDGFPWTSSQGTAKTQMPNPAGGKYDVGIGQTGNGYARITYIPD